MAERINLRSGRGVGPVKLFPDFEDPEDNRDDFHKIQEEIDNSQWIGRGPHYILDGGGNTPEAEQESEVNPDRDWR